MSEIQKLLNVAQVVVERATRSDIYPEQFQKTMVRKLELHISHAHKHMNFFLNIRVPLKKLINLLKFAFRLKNMLKSF